MLCRHIPYLLKEVLKSMQIAMGYNTQKLIICNINTKLSCNYNALSNENFKIKWKESKFVKFLLPTNRRQDSVGKDCHTTSEVSSTLWERKRCRIEFHIHFVIIIFVSNCMCTFISNPIYCKRHLTDLLLSLTQQWNRTSCWMGFVLNAVSSKKTRWKKGLNRSLLGPAYGIWE